MFQNAFRIAFVAAAPSNPHRATLDPVAIPLDAWTDLTNARLPRIVLIAA